MLVCQSNDALVLQIVTVNSEFLKSIVVVLAHEENPLRLEYVEPKQSSVEVQQEDIIIVYLGIHNSQCLQVKGGPINDSQWLDFCRIFHRYEEDLHIGVISSCSINCISKVASEQISESSSLGM